MSSLESGIVRALKPVGAALLLLLLLYRVDWSSLASSARDIHIGFLALAAGCFLAITVVEVRRLVVAMDLESSSWLVPWRLQFIGNFCASFFPGQLGGDVYKTIRLSERFGGNLTPAIRLLQIRAAGLAVLVAALVIVAAVERSAFRVALDRVQLANQPLALVGLIGVGLVVGAALWALKQDTRHKVYHDVISAITGMTYRKTATLLALSVGTLFFRVTTLQALCLATGQRIGFSSALFVATSAAIATLLPLSIAGLGVREGTVVVGLLTFGVAYEPAVLIALLNRMFIVVLALFGGILFWYDVSHGRAN